MMDRDTKLIATLRRQYHIMLMALGENILLTYANKYVSQVERIEISISRGLISLQFYLSL